VLNFILSFWDFLSQQLPCVLIGHTPASRITSPLKNVIEPQKTELKLSFDLNVQRIILFPFSTWAVLEQLSLCFPYIKVFTKPTLKTNKAPNENKLKTKTKHHRDYLSLVN